MGAVKPQDLWVEQKARRSCLGGLEAFSAQHELKPYRFGQLYHAAAKELVDSLDSITALPKSLRERLESGGFALDSVAPVVIPRSNDGQTSKGLFRLHDGTEVEAVLMEHYGERSTICISSQ